MLSNPPLHGLQFSGGCERLLSASYTETHHVQNTRVPAPVEIKAPSDANHSPPIRCPAKRLFLVTIQTVENAPTFTLSILPAPGCERPFYNYILLFIRFPESAFMRLEILSARQ